MRTLVISSAKRSIVQAGEKSRGDGGEENARGRDEDKETTYDVYLNMEPVHGINVSGRVLWTP